jgi:hypothetical protein
LYLEKVLLSFSDMKYTPSKRTLLLLAHFCFSLFIFKANMNAAEMPSSLAFQKADDGGLVFNTGVIKGKLGEKGIRKGFSSLVHVPTGQSMDRSMGIMSIYRVFGDGKRFGTGAWDLPGTIQLEPNGAALIQWPAAPDRPFTMEARYKWAAPDTADIEIQVSANRDLPKFETFLSSYFHESFNQCAVLCRTNLPSGKQYDFISAEKRWGDWLMFPKNDLAVSLIKDGRWQLLPNPVNWTIMPPFAKPIGFRSSTKGITAVFMAPESDCFDIACPHQAEGHYSLYLSLFGRDIKAGEIVKARVRMVITTKNDLETVEQLYSQWLPR